MDNNKYDKIERYKSDDEIDLVDILAVLIKRKWIIIILLILSFVLSVGYVKVYKEKPTNYLATFNLALPEEYTIDTDYILVNQIIDPTYFINSVKSKINQYKVKNDDTINFSINFDNKNNSESDNVEKLINITITASNYDDTLNASIFLYKLYKNYKDKILEKNKNIYEIAQNSLNQKLKQKQAIIDMLMRNFNKNSSLNKNQETNSAIVYVIDFLSNDISELKRIKTLNQEVLLNEGKIEITNGLNQLILNDTTLSKIENYIKPETSSKKKTLLPIIISVFLALFVGIFFAFVIEFFSREDVKKRLREASKR